NKAFLGEQISCTNNASSILVVAKRDFPELGRVTDHALNPQGPKGRYHLLNPQSHSIFTFAQDVNAAKAFLRWLYDDRQLSAWLVAGDAYYAPFLHAYDTTRCGTRSLATSPTRSRSRPRACPAGRAPRATRCPRAWRSTRSSTCSPRRARGRRPKR